MKYETTACIRSTQYEITRKLSNALGRDIGFGFRRYDDKDIYTDEGKMLDKKLVYKELAKEFGVNAVKSVEKGANGIVYVMVEPEEPKEIRVNIDGEHMLIACKNTDNDYKEIFVGIENKDKVYQQDLAIIGCDYEYDDDLNVNIIPDKYVVKVFSDAKSEDYTHSIRIEKAEIDD